MTDPQNTIGDINPTMGGVTCRHIDRQTDTHIVIIIIIIVIIIITIVSGTDIASRIIITNMGVLQT